MIVCIGDNCAFFIFEYNFALIMHNMENARIENIRKNIIEELKVAIFVKNSGYLMSYNTLLIAKIAKGNGAKNCLIEYLSDKIENTYMNIYEFGGIKRIKITEITTNHFGSWCSSFSMMMDDCRYFVNSLKGICGIGDLWADILPSCDPCICCGERMSHAQLCRRCLTFVNEIKNRFYIIMILMSSILLPDIMYIVMNLLLDDNMYWGSGIYLLKVTKKIYK